MANSEYGLNVNSNPLYCQTCRLPLNPYQDSVYYEGDSLDSLVMYHINCKPKTAGRIRSKSWSKNA